MTEDMIEATVTILAGKGIHMQPATELSKLAFKHEALNIRLIKGSRSADATSIMGILSLELAHGSSVKVVLAEEDKEVLQSIRNILEGQPLS